MDTEDKRFRFAELHAEAEALRIEYAAIYHDYREGRLTLDAVLAVIRAVLEETRAVTNEMRALVAVR